MEPTKQVEMKEKSFLRSTSLWSSTALITLFLTMVSLYFKAVGHAVGETIPLVVLALGSYALNVRGRLIADTKLVLKEKD